MSGVRVLITARRGLDYNRVRVLLAGLRAVAPEDFDVYAFGERNRATGAELERRARACDVVYVPPFRARDVAFAKRWGAGRPVVFDPLIGTTITRVVDFGWWWRRPLARLRDRRDFGRADHLIFDTEAHRAWSVATLGLDAERTHVLHIGSDTAAFPAVGVRPWRPGDPLTVGFYGSYVPLQGGEVIIEAASRLAHRREIGFELIGDVDASRAVRRARYRFPDARVEYVPHLGFDELAGRLRGYDVCLGVFGASLKADVVAPNKLYHYAALGKPIVTRESRGAREVFGDGEVLFVEPTAEALATAIEALADDPSFARSLGEAAARRTREHLTERHVAERFLAICRLAAGR